MAIKPPPIVFHGCQQLAPRPTPTGLDLTHGFPCRFVAFVCGWPGRWQPFVFDSVFVGVPSGVGKLPRVRFSFASLFDAPTLDLNDRPRIACDSFDRVASIKRLAKLSLREYSNPIGLVSQQNKGKNFKNFFDLI